MLNENDWVVWYNTYWIASIIEKDILSVMEIHLLLNEMVVDSFGGGGGI